MQSFIPVLQHRVWGGDLLPELFADDAVQRPVGEAWLLSDHPSARTHDEQGKTLENAAPGRPWFPVLIKLLHATTDLSVQVHPNDEQAKAIGDLGKTEGWLILHAEPGARICYGHTASSEEELRRCIADGQLEQYLRYVEVSAGDYFAVPPGTVHALGGGILALEVQQSSDTTYRLYDYNRPDAFGNLRTLHVEEGLAVTTYPQPPVPDQSQFKYVNAQGKTVYEDHSYYAVAALQVHGKHTEKGTAGHLLCVILLDGDVAPDDLLRPARKYETWLFAEGETVNLSGTGRVALVTIPM